MNQVQAFIFRLLIASLALCSCFAVRTLAQTPSPSPSPSQEATKAPDTKAEDEEDKDPFAPEPPAVLPPGMTGSDVNDPRASLKPGIWDAGEAAMGIKHLLLVKKPDAF